MNWVALDRGIRLADKRALPANRAKWLQARDCIYEEVMSHGWSQKRGAFTQFYGSEDLDASLLIMPLVFFMAPNDPRMLSTMAAILESPRNGGLVSDSLVTVIRRNPALTDFRVRKALSTCARSGLWRRLRERVRESRKSLTKPDLCLSECWVMRIISGFTQNKQVRKERLWAIFRKPSLILH